MFFSRATLNYMASRAKGKTTKDVWKKRYYEDNHMSLVHDSLLFQLDLKLNELRICAERINDVSLTRIYNDLNLNVAILLGKTESFDLSQHQLPQQKQPLLSQK